MRKTLFLILIVLVSVTWVAAQQPDSRPSTDQPSQSGPATNADRPMPAPPAPADNSGQAPAPSASASSQSTSSGQIIEGCLGGSHPDFTVTDKAGTVYKLDIPKDADATQLTSHVGESVKVKGTVSAPSSASSGNATAGSAPSDKPMASSSQTIMVEQIGRGTGTCPAGAAQPKSK